MFIFFGSFVWSSTKLEVSSGFLCRWKLDWGKIIKSSAVCSFASHSHHREAFTPYRTTQELERPTLALRRQRETHSFHGKSEPGGGQFVSEAKARPPRTSCFPYTRTNIYNIPNFNEDIHYFSIKKRRKGNPWRPKKPEEAMRSGSRRIGTAETLPISFDDKSFSAWVWRWYTDNTGTNSLRVRSTHPFHSASLHLDKHAISRCLLRYQTGAEYSARCKQWFESSCKEPKFLQLNTMRSS